jgi:hypothetical protein
MTNILLIGAGQIGSRYLEGITKEKSCNYNIIVVDTSQERLNLAKNYWEKLGGNNSTHKVFWSQKLVNFFRECDIAIIATGSQNRASLIVEVAKVIKVNYWVIEKILCQSTKELEIIKSYTSNSFGVYVNMSRRQMDWYKDIKSKLNFSKLISVKKVGGLWGLACNSLHFFDLVTWLTSETLKKISTTKLNKKWFKSKREGYYEISGELSATFSSGIKLQLQSYSNVLENTLLFEFSNKEIWKVDELNGLASSSGGKILNGKFRMQSEMTSSMIKKILTKGMCDLPNLQESSHYHSIYLKALLKHWNITNNRKDKLVPIT